MPHDSALLAETRGWLAKARDDIEAGRRLLQGTSPMASVAAFHAQQNAEKSLKALLTFHGVDFEKSHNLDDLGRKCVSIHGKLQAAASAVAPISGYAVETRYPGDWDEPDKDEAQLALRVARDLYNAILALLPAEANP